MIWRKYFFPVKDADYLDRMATLRVELDRVAEDLSAKGVRDEEFIAQLRALQESYRRPGDEWKLSIIERLVSAFHSCIIRLTSARFRELRNGNRTDAKKILRPPGFAFRHFLGHFCTKNTRELVLEAYHAEALQYYVDCIIAKDSVGATICRCLMYPTMIWLVAHRALAHVFQIAAGQLLKK